MLEALNHNNEHILAKNAIKNVDYYCPHCHSKLILKKGIKVMPHFAHESQSQRWCAKGESELHYHAKYQDLSGSIAPVPEGSYPASSPSRG